MATPTLKAVPVTGAAPSFAEPVEIYDLPSGVTQAAFDALVARVAALETP